MRDTIKEMGASLAAPIKEPIPKKTLILIGLLIVIAVFVFRDTISVLGDWMKQAAEKAAESV